MKITLKDAFTLQNYLGELSNKALMLLDPDNFAKITVTREYSKAGIEENDKIDEPQDLVKKEFDFSFSEILDFYQDITNEKVELTKAIEESKSRTSFNLDSAKTFNVMNRSLISMIKSTLLLKTKEIAGTDRIYKKDVEGKQAMFVYNTISKTEYDIDKNIVKAVIKRLEKQMIENSNEMDKYILERKLETNCKYEVTDSLEDAFEKFKGKNRVEE